MTVTNGVESIIPSTPTTDTEPIVISPSPSPGSGRHHKSPKSSKGKSSKRHRSKSKSPKSPKSPKDTPKYPRIRIKPPTPPEEKERLLRETEEGERKEVLPPAVDMEDLIPESVISVRKPPTFTLASPPQPRQPKTPVARPPPLPLVSGGETKLRVSRPPPLPLISEGSRAKVARPPPLPLASGLDMPVVRKVGRPPKVSLKIFNNAPPPGRPKIKYVSRPSQDPPPIKRKRGRPRKSEQTSHHAKVARMTTPTSTLSQGFSPKPHSQGKGLPHDRVPPPAPFVVVEGVSQEITVQDTGLNLLGVAQPQGKTPQPPPVTQGSNPPDLASGMREQTVSDNTGFCEQDPIDNVRGVMEVTEGDVINHVSSGESPGEALEEPPPSNCTLASDDTGFGSEPPAPDTDTHPGEEVVDLSKNSIPETLGYSEESQGFSCVGTETGVEEACANPVAPSVVETQVQVADSTGSPSLQEGDVTTLSQIPPAAELAMERYMGGPQGGVEMVEAVSSSPQPQTSAVTKATVETQTSPDHCGPQSPSASPASPEIRRVNGHTQLCRPQDKQKKAARLDAMLGKIHDKAIKEQQLQLSPSSSPKSPPTSVQRVNGHAQLSPKSPHLSPKSGQLSPRPHPATQRQTLVPTGAVRSSSGPRLGAGEATPRRADSTQDPATPIGSLTRMCTGIDREPGPQERCGTPRPPPGMGGMNNNKPPALPFRCVGPALPSGVILTNGQTNPPLLPPPPPYPGPGELRREPARVPSYRPRAQHRQPRVRYPGRGPGRPPLHQRGPGRPPVPRTQTQRRLPPPAYYEPPVNPLANGYDAPLELTTKRSRDRRDDSYPMEPPNPHLNRACLKIPSLVRP